MERRIGDLDLIGDLVGLLGGSLLGERDLRGDIERRIGDLDLIGDLLGGSLLGERDLLGDTGRYGDLIGLLERLRDCLRYGGGDIEKSLLLRLLSIGDNDGLLGEGPLLLGYGLISFGLCLLPSLSCLLNLGGLLFISFLLYITVTGILSITPLFIESNAESAPS